MADGDRRLRDLRFYLGWNRKTARDVAYPVGPHVSFDDTIEKIIAAHADFMRND